MQSVSVLELESVGRLRQMHGLRMLSTKAKLVLETSKCPKNKW